MNAAWMLALALAVDWDRFRGPNGTGVADEAGAPPVEFGPEKNLAWKTALPAGLSSPLVSGQRVFLTAAEKGELITLALDRATGRVLWRRAVTAARTEKLHELNHASAASVAIGAKRIVSFFGDYGLVAYDHDGGERWRKPLGPFHNLYGVGASPVVAGERMFLVVDQSKDSFIAAFELASGKELWRTARPAAISGHSTPVLYKGLVIAPGSFEMNAYDARTGKLVWTVDGLPSEMKAVPSIEGSLLYIHGFNTPDNDPGRIVKIPDFAAVIAAHDANRDGLIARAEAPTEKDRKVFPYVDLDSNGTMDKAEWDQYQRTMAAENALLVYDLAAAGRPALKWKFQRSIPQLPSPLVYRGVVYMVNEAGVLTTLDAATGTLHKQARVRGRSDRYYASPVAAGGRVYVASHSGVVSVLEAGAEQKLLASTDLGEEILATPALIAPGRILIRTRTALWCFAAP